MILLFVYSVFRYDLSGLWVEFKAATSGKTSGKIIELIKLNTQITIPEIAVIVGVTERSIERNIQILQKDSIIKRVGSPKGGHWEIIEQ